MGLLWRLDSVRKAVGRRTFSENTFISKTVHVFCPRYRQHHKHNQVGSCLFVLKPHSGLIGPVSR